VSEGRGDEAVGRRARSAEERLDAVDALGVARGVAVDVQLVAELVLHVVHHEVLGDLE
jgi:hypothetical protein